MTRNIPFLIGGVLAAADFAAQLAVHRAPGSPSHRAAFRRIHQRHQRDPALTNRGSTSRFRSSIRVVIYDRRNIGLTLEGQPIVASDQERLIVDAIVRWRIVDPRLFYQSALTEEGGVSRLETFTEAAMRRALGGATSNDIISGRRAELMQAIENDLNARRAAELGVRVVDVRIRQADLPDETRERVYERMRSERQQVAGRIRAEGERDAAIIRATAQRGIRTSAW